MASIKAFFKKKQLDAKFKSSGPGRKLTDSSGPVASSEPPGPSQPRPPPTPTAHLEAALSRLNTAQKSKNVNWSVAHIKAQARKELEQKKAQQQEGNGQSTEGPSTKSKSNNPPMVQGIYFTCELLGPETGSYEQILNNIQEYLYSQLPEEPVLTSILIMYSCNEMSRMRTGVDTLARYLTNIIEHPGEEKYRKIRLQNKVFQERVASLTGALEFLEAVGFVKTELPTLEGEGEETYLVFLSDTEDPEKLKEHIESLNSGEAIVPRLDRNLQVLAPAVAATHMELPDDFFNLTLDELRREQALKKRKVDLLTQMRTSAQREQDELCEPVRQYGYTVIRIRLPDDTILQGTFSAFERVEDVEQFVKDHLADPSLHFTLRGPGGEKLEGPLTLVSLHLVPAAVIYLHSEQSSDGSLLSSHVMALLQTLPPA